MKRFLQKRWLIILIICASLFLRLYKGQEWFTYTHDNDLTGWFIKDVVVNKHPRLVGQITSTPGFHIGPLFYYYQLPFYLLSKMDPIAGMWAVTLLGALSTLSFWFVFTKVFGKKEGHIAAIVQAFSYYLIFNEREAVPTMPVILWTVWFLYSLHLLINGKKMGMVLLGLLVGLIWHLNVALVLTLPAAALAIFLSKKKIAKEGLINGLILLIIFSLPLIIFELRHNFPQVKALYLAFSTPQDDIISGYDKFQRVLLLLSKNVKTFLFSPSLGVSYFLALATSIFGFAYLSLKKIISRNLSLVLSLWLVSFIVFFSMYSKVLSEYYLNGALIIFICVLVLAISSLLTSKYRALGATFLAIYLLLNMIAFLRYSPSRNGYLEKKAIISAIDKDRLKFDYPCISISYITDPGYDLGYRHFFFLRNMHVNHPDSGAPVYTIVFPLKDIFPTDENFGALGLIHPDYSRYTKEGVINSCSGQNSNLIDPMLGFTE